MADTAELTGMDRQAWLTLLESYRGARALMAAVELGVFDGLSSGPASSEDLAAQLDLPPRTLGLLMNACRVMGLLELDNDQYSNTPAAQAYLLDVELQYLGHAAKLETTFFGQWVQLTDAIRSGKPIEWGASAGNGHDHSGAEGEQETDWEHTGSEAWSQDEWSQKFIWGMHDRAVGKAEMLAEHLDLKGRKQLYDVGGGSGAFSVALVEHNPGLRATVFDVPSTLAVTRAVVEASDVQDRITLQEGNYHEDEFGAADSNDVVLISGVLGAEGEESCLRLLAKAHRSLEPGGVLVIRDYMTDEQGGSLVAALFSLHMIMVTDQGQTHSEAEMVDWVARAGFEGPKLEHMPAPDESTLVLARK